MTKLLTILASILLTIHCCAQPIGKWQPVTSVKYDNWSSGVEGFYLFDSATLCILLSEPGTNALRAIAYSEDGAETWIRKNIDFSLFNLIEPPDFGHLYLRAYDNEREDTARVSIYLSTNQGNSWEFIRRDTVSGFYNVVMFDSLNGLRVYKPVGDSSHRAELTLDGGRTFPIAVTDSLFYATIDTADFTNELRFFTYIFSRTSSTSVIGIGHSHGSGSRRQLPIIHSNDRGKTWKIASSPHDSTEIFLFRANVTTGTPYVSLILWPTSNGSYKSPSFYYSTNEGSDWQKSRPFDTLIRTAAVTSPLDFWTSGLYPNACVLGNTSNGGLTWLTDSSTTKDIFIRHIGFTASGHGFAYGNNRKSWDSLIYFFRYSENQSSIERPGITEPLRSKSYPNPCDQSLTLWTGLPATNIKNITVYDAVGRVLSPPYNVCDAYVELEMKSVRNGAYSVVIQSDSQQIISSILVLH